MEFLLQPDLMLHKFVYDTVRTNGHENHVFSSPEPKAHGELAVSRSSRRLLVRPSTLSNMNISKTSGSIVTKFYLKHHWVAGKDA